MGWRNVIGLVFVWLFFAAGMSAQNARIVEMMNAGQFQAAANILELNAPYEKMDLADLSALGMCYIHLRNYQQGELVFSELTSRQRTRPMHFLYYGEVLLVNEKFEKAKSAFQTYLKDFPDDERVQLKIRSCDSLQAWADYQTDVTISNADSLTSKFDEKSPLLFNQQLAFVSNRTFDRRGNLVETADQSEGYLIKKQELEPFFPELLDEYTCGAMAYDSVGGVIAFSLRKKIRYMQETRFAFSNIYFKDAQQEAGELELFQWPGMPGEINVSNPAFSNNGKRLYFSSDMPGGYGGHDIYYSDRTPDGGWSKPINLGENINTRGQELFPSVSGDTLLFFASDGWPGYGNLDIYKSTIEEDGFSPALNLKAPVNSIGNDFSFILVNPWLGYFSSNRSDGSKGMNDIFVYSRPLPVEEEPIDSIIPAVPYVFNPSTFALPPVYFANNSARVPECYSDFLQDIADTLNKYEYLSIQLLGYADNNGATEYNLSLAGRRAAALQQHLRTLEVDAARIATKNKGVAKDSAGKGLTYHILVGTVQNPSAHAWYEELFNNAYPISSFRKKEYYLYVAGSFSDYHDANAALENIRDSYDIVPRIVASAGKLLLFNLEKGVNRRVELQWQLEDRR